MAAHAETFEALGSALARAQERARVANERTERVQRLLRALLYDESICTRVREHMAQRGMSESAAGLAQSELGLSTAEWDLMESFLATGSFSPTPAAPRRVERSASGSSASSASSAASFDVRGLGGASMLDESLGFADVKQPAAAPPPGKWARGVRRPRQPPRDRTWELTAAFACGVLVGAAWKRRRE